jgi:hypothetical protein
LFLLGLLLFLSGHWGHRGQDGDEAEQKNRHDEGFASG